MIHGTKNFRDAVNDADIHKMDRVVYFATPSLGSRDREIIRSYDMEEDYEELLSWKY